MQDIAEVFTQRSSEIDASGELGKRFEYFWDNLYGDHSLTQKLKTILPSASLILDQLFAAMMNKIVAGWSYILSSPPTESDLAAHRTRLDALAAEGQKLILVAHSQGNLFVNNGYDYISPTIGKASVTVAHIAPASPTLRGDYVLADIDLVINGLRATGVTSVPRSNLTLPASSADVSGHMLVETYLDSSRPGRNRVATMINDAIASLKTPATKGNVGAFTVTLTWDGPGDVDLHTFEPNGSHVFYNQKAGVSGYLDIDNTVANGPEHYYASCDPTTLQVGTYSIGINNFSSATGRTATVQVSTSNEGVLFTKSVDVGPERERAGDESPIPVVNAVVTKNSNGNFSFATN